MPQLKQPPPLKFIVLQSLQRYIQTLGQDLLREVCSGASGIIPSTRSGMPSYPAEERNHKFYKLEELQQFLQPGLPLPLSNEVTSAILEAITTLISQAKCTYDGFSKSGDDSCREIIEKLISAALHDHITRVDLLQWPWIIGEILLKNLEKFQHLEDLKFCPTSWGPLWITVVERMENGCYSLENLVSFSMRCHCTDKILQVMAYCTRLKYLDVMSSVEVTDTCVSSVLQMKNLKVINVWSTSLTADGYIKLLIGLPHLSKLAWFDLNSQVLARMKTSPLSLQNYEASRVSADQLIIMVQMCPYLKQVSFHKVEADLSVLGTLKHLREIKITQCNAVNSNLKGLLAIVGYNITSLELYEVGDVDLLMIGVLCVNLKRMGLICEFQSSDSSFLGIKAPLFKELEDLRFGSKYSECLFFNCTNIRKLEISRCDNLNDDVFAELLRRNPLKQLQLLSICHSGRLSMNTVYLLLDSCDKLRVLEGLDSWGGITKSQVMELCTEMKRRNMDIEILWKKPLTISW